MTYLSELFLDELGEDFSRQSVQNALEICNEEYLSRPKDNVSETELRDLMDCYFEFSGLFPKLDLPLLVALKPLRREWPQYFSDVLSDVEASKPRKSWWKNLLIPKKQSLV